MNYYLDILSDIIGDGFEKAGFSREYGKVSESNRPDLCEFQCNGALSCAKTAKMNPMDIVEKVLAEVDRSAFTLLEGVRPGFINMSVSEEHLTGYLNQIKNDVKFGLKEVEDPKTIVIDYGGPNAAKPLHVGHLRPAIIGESIKRLERYAGHKVIGDVHLGDWGMPMGLIIAELSLRYPEWVYFDENYDGDYPEESPVSIRELEEIYPFASSKSKEDEEFKKLALKCTKELQEGRKGYRALWKHMIDVSIADLKVNFKNLNVEFDLWYGEAYSDKYIPDMVKKMKDEGYAYISNGALVVDVKKDDDKKEIPPCIILKSDGASLYETTDLATIVQRVEDYNPDSIVYVVDKRQELHFEQVFRCARKTQIVGDDTELKFIGFGTMNGKDGKPFKTRDGQVMRLKDLFENVVGSMKEKISQNEDLSKDQADSIANMVGLAAIKFGDLSNQASKDYIFDIDRFTSFEGKTGPYILYTMVRIKSILAKYGKSIDEIKNYKLVPARLNSEKQLELHLAKFNATMENAASEYAPHKVCGYMYDLTNCFNSFYHEKRILDETDEMYQQGLIAMSYMTYEILSSCTDILGFDVPEKM
ncbi:MAG: arginine--tRNA ligase [Eubacterium sp.]|nr:arginine--tRNA ligase [Eubacterium sp.]